VRPGLSSIWASRARSAAPGSCTAVEADLHRPEQPVPHLSHKRSCPLSTFRVLRG
jgi:hypothetical protein